MEQAIAEHVPDGSSVALGLQMEQMIPFAAGHELIRQKRRDLRLIGPISDILFDQLIGAGCVKDVVAAWVGNVMMGSAYNFRHATEVENPGAPGEKLRVFNMTNFTLALALQAGAMGVPFLPTRTAMGSDVPNEADAEAGLQNRRFREVGGRRTQAANRRARPDLPLTIERVTMRLADEV